MKLYVPQLIIVSLFLWISSCKKKDSYPDYSEKMKGMRHWVGVKIYSAYWVPAGPPLYADTGRRIIDTSLAIETEGSGVVVIFGRKLNYIKEDRVVKAVVYEYPKKTPTDEMEIELVYYYERDSMTYNYSNWHHQYGTTTTLNTRR